MDLNRFFTTVGEVVQGVSDVAVINNWLTMDDQSAHASIRAQVESSSVQDIDRLDAALLTMASSQISRDTGRRLTEFYALFKILETLRFGEFRGFPR